MQLSSVLAIKQSLLGRPGSGWPGAPPMVGRRLVQMGANPAYARPFAGAPVQSLGRFHGTDDTLKMMVDYARGTEGEQNATVRQWAEAIVRLLRPKDYLSEILAIRHWCTGPQLRYANDARHVEQVKSPLRIFNEIQAYGVSNVDCDDFGCLISSLGMCLGREARLTCVGFSIPGDYTHVFAGLKEPRSGDWIVCDPVAGTRELEMLRAATSYKHVSVDE